MPLKGLFETQNFANGGKMTGKYKKVWVEESFNFEKNKGSQIASLETKNFLGESIDASKIKWLAILACLGFLIIFLKVVYLQVWNGDHYRVLAENNRVRLRTIPSERGIIFDRTGKPLVENVPSFLLSIVPQDLPSSKNAPVQRKKVINQIASLSSVPKEDIETLLEKYKNYSYESLTIKENLDYDTALNLYIKNANLPGLLIEKSTKRHYLTGVFQAEKNIETGPSSLSHLSGYLGKITPAELEEKHVDGYLLNDSIGRNGLERIYEHDLRGTYGIKKIEMDVLGREQRVLSEEAPLPGKNLYLSLDLDMQNKLEELIRAHLITLGKKRASGIVLNPQNGAILAMVSWPAFDANQFSGSISQTNYDSYINNPDLPLFNRAIGGTYPSGSTIKMIISAAALEEKVITATTQILSNGGIQVDRWYFKDWKAGGHGMTDVRKAIAWSVNTFFYYIGGGYKNFVGLGVERIVRYMRMFNLGARTEIDLPGEATGFLPSKEWKQETKGEIWYVGDTYNLSIGQGDLLVTPLQVAVWTMAVANGGIVYQPHLADRFYNPTTKKEEAIKLKILNQNFISPYNMSVVKLGMKDCVTTGGCGLSMESLPFTAGGKTGTAQWSSNKDDHAWFTSFAPFNTPQVVVTIMVEEGEEGGSASVPIARDFLAWWGPRYMK